MTQPAPSPASASIRFADSVPSLWGARCQACGQPFLAPPLACPSCFARGSMVAERLSDRGRLYNFTIVHRSFPGVPTPFVMAIVDLDHGPTIRATLADVPAEPSSLRFDMPVRLDFRDSAQRDADGRPYLTYVFVPAEAEGGL